MILGTPLFSIQKVVAVLISTAFRSYQANKKTSREKSIITLLVLLNNYCKPQLAKSDVLIH